MRAVSAVVLYVVALAAPAAWAEEWKNVPVVDTSCVSRVRADPDSHTRSCALQCVKGGYGLIAPDGTYLKFDAAGNQKAHAALKASSKTDHLRAHVIGQRDGDTLKVTSLTLD